MRELCSGSIYTLYRENGDMLFLRNERTRRDHRFTYKAPTMYSRSPGYKVESDWSGPPEQLFSRIIPMLETIQALFGHHKEQFSSALDHVETSHGETIYCSQFVTSRLTFEFPADKAGGGKGALAKGMVEFRNWEVRAIAIRDQDGAPLESGVRRLRAKLHLPGAGRRSQERGPLARLKRWLVS